MKNFIKEGVKKMKFNLSKTKYSRGGLYLGGTVVIVASISGCVASDSIYDSKQREEARNKLNQIYWRTIAWNTIRAMSKTSEHGWIRDDYYNDSITKVIGEAIADGITRRNEFEKRGFGGVVTFDHTKPEGYSPENWNAVIFV